MDLKEIYDFFDYTLNKERGVFITYPEKDLLFDRAQWWFYNSEFDYYAKSQELKDSLSTFSTKLSFSVTDGLVNLPTNPNVIPCYEHLLSMHVQYYDNVQAKTRYKPIKFLSEDEIAERLDSQILAPTISNPVGEQIAPGSFQLYPATSLAGYSYYLRKPAKPFFSYTEGADGRTIVYDQAGSTQLEWNTSSINKIIVKALQFAGVNINDEMIIQFTELKNQQDI